jgi:hypothetical protein
MFNPKALSWARPLKPVLGGLVFSLGYVYGLERKQDRALRFLASNFSLSCPA